MGGSVTERFWAKVDVGHPAGCWMWTSVALPKGYGVFTVNGAGDRTYAHRFAYELLVGPIPDGLQIDHLCRVPGCVNPDHLEPVTPHENLRRGYSPSMVAARRKRCRQGHWYTRENTRFEKAGGRKCRTCDRERQRRAYWAARSGEVRR